MFSSPADIVIADAKDKNDDTLMDLATVELEKFTIPLPNPKATKK